MALSVPAAMSVVGDAVEVRHLRAGGKSWAVWTEDDVGVGRRFVYRERTGSITLIGSLNTDGVDFTDKVVPIQPMKIDSFHVVEIDAGIALFAVSDGESLFSFEINVNTNVVTSPLTKFSEGSSPGQFSADGVPRQFWLRGNKVYVRVGSDPESKIIDLSGLEAKNLDVVRKGSSEIARYAGLHVPNRSVPLLFLSDVNTLCCYNAADIGQQSVTQALPPGCVAYWTFDSADFVTTTMQDVSGNARHATLVGTAPASVSGLVGQARDFIGGAADGHYTTPNHASLQIVGDMTIAFWIRPDNFAQRVVPYEKAFGGEGSVVVELDGTFAFYYGSSGGNSDPWSVYNSRQSLDVGAWNHAAVVRDMTNRFVRLFINGRLTAHHTAAQVPAASSLAPVIGKGHTGQKVDGLLDEMLICNQAMSPGAIAALYAKGVSGARASTSGSGSHPTLQDSGPAARHAVLMRGAIAGPRGIALATTTSSQRQIASLPSFAATPALTIEARIWPRWRTSSEALIFSNYSTATSLGTRVQGTVTFALAQDGTLRFRFETTTASIELRQTGGERVRVNDLNYVAVSHTFGAGSSSFMVVNGVVVPAQWFFGGGSESPTLIVAAPQIALNHGDELIGLRVSSVAKTQAQIRDYLRGRS